MAECIASRNRGLAFQHPDESQPHMKPTGRPHQFLRLVHLENGLFGAAAGEIRWHS